MRNLKKFLFANHFSHIYVEKEILSHKITREILEEFKNSTIVKIENYKEFFGRPRQDFRLQEMSKKLILAKKRGNFLYEGPAICQDFGFKNFYYTSNILNCIYTCDYCFLKGMYPSANIVIFVNIEDYFKEIELLLKRHPLYLSVSYETDLWALEKIAPFCSMWVEFASSRKNLIIEIRTKSADYKVLEKLKPSENIILAWSLSPKEVIKKFEHKTPSLEARIFVIKKAIEKGFKVRLCFDPILAIDNFEKIYKNFLEEVFKDINPNNVLDASLGVFRIPKEYFKNMKKRFANEITAFPYEEKEGIYTYPKELRERLITFTYLKLKEFISPSKIFIV